MRTASRSSALKALEVRRQLSLAAMEASIEQIRQKAYATIAHDMRAGPTVAAADADRAAQDAELDGGNLDDEE